MNPLRLLSLAACLLVGCTTASVQQTAGGNARLNVATIQINDAGLDADGMQDFRERNLAGKLQAALRQKLIAQNKLRSDGAELIVTINHVRVRSTAAVFWVGVMAGGDEIGATARVVQRGKVVREFVVTASKSGGALAGVGATGRVDRMCEELAEELTRQL